MLHYYNTAVSTFTHYKLFAMSSQYEFKKKRTKNLYFYRLDFL